MSKLDDFIKITEECREHCDKQATNAFVEGNLESSQYIINSIMDANYKMMNTLAFALKEQFEELNSNLIDIEDEIKKLKRNNGTGLPR